MHSFLKKKKLSASLKDSFYQLNKGSWFILFINLLNNSADGMV